MLWSRDDLTEYLLDRMNLKVLNEEKKHQFFNQALILALQKDKVRGTSGVS